MFLRNKWALASLFLLCWALAASIIATYYYSKYVRVRDTYLELRDEAFSCHGAVNKLARLIIKVNIGFNYGNSTLEWHNSTIFPFGVTLLNATIKVARVEYVVSPQPKQEILVMSINGLENNIEENLSWQYHYWNITKKEWVLVPVSCESLILHNTGTYLWNYTIV